MITKTMICLCFLALATQGMNPGNGRRISLLARNLSMNPPTRRISHTVPPNLLTCKNFGGLQRTQKINASIIKPYKNPVFATSDTSAGTFGGQFRKGFSKTFVTSMGEAAGKSAGKAVGKLVGTGIVTAVVTAGCWASDEMKSEHFFNLEDKDFMVEAELKEAKFFMRFCHDTYHPEKQSAHQIDGYKRIHVESKFVLYQKNNKSQQDPDPEFILAFQGTMVTKINGVPVIANPDDVHADAQIVAYGELPVENAEGRFGKNWYNVIEALKTHGVTGGADFAVLGHSLGCTYAWMFSRYVSKHVNELKPGKVRVFGMPAPRFSWLDEETRQEKIQQWKNWLTDLKAKIPDSKICGTERDNCMVPWSRLKVGDTGIFRFHPTYARADSGKDFQSAHAAELWLKEHKPELQ